MAAADPRTLDVSVVVPARNEEATIQILVDEVVAALLTRPELSYEIVLVDDGSDDGTWRAMTGASSANSAVRALRLRRNFGKATALAAGIDVATGGIIATLDADLQDDPRELSVLLDGLDCGRDLVSGHKKIRHDPLRRRLPSRFFNRVTGLVSGLRLQDHNSGLRVGRRQVYETIPLYGELHRYVPALAHANGFRVAEVTVRHRARTHGRSKYGLERYLRGALDLLTVMSLTRYGRRPAHLFGGIGVLFGLIGTAILLYLTGVWVFTDRSIGQRPLLQLGILLEVVGVQFVGMGVLAELVVFRTPQHGDASSPIAADTRATSGTAGATDLTVRRDASAPKPSLGSTRTLADRDTSAPLAP